MRRTMRLTMLCIAARRSLAFVPRAAPAGACIAQQARPQLQRRVFSDVGRPVTETRTGSARRASVAADPELEEDEEVNFLFVSPELPLNLVVRAIAQLLRSSARPLCIT
jgi:hypothetical protein